MRILGIDPGYAIVGFSVIDYDGNKFKLITSGAVLTEAHTSFPNRLKIIYDEIDDIISRYKPDCMSIEELFFNTNTTTAIAVAEARGVILVVAKNHEVPIFEYTPIQIKQAVTGYGRATKYQVQDMVKMILCVDKLPKLDDTTDSMAMCICHAHSHKFAKAL